MTETTTLVHQIRKGIRCDTEARGFATPDNLSPEELVLQASEGFIPLWAKGTTLRWKFRASSFQLLPDPEGTKNHATNLMAKALLAWGDAVPIKFSRNPNVWDFEVVWISNDDCDDTGCVLASAFFPDGGRHRLNLYPILFEQSEEEQIATLAHELGHVFGLRHFFAQISETFAKSQIFGTHDPFTIMNYGDKSVLTNNDRADLKKLYELAWSGQLTAINDTPIKLVKPYHEL